MNDADAIVGSWREDWRLGLQGSDPARESAIAADVREAIAVLQQAGASNGERGHALHRKTLLESRDASFEVSPGLPRVLQLGPLLPGAAWVATVRLSNAFPTLRSDELPDQRGLAVRVSRGEATVDLLATTGEAHHARDDHAMLASLRAAAKAARGGTRGRIGALAALIRALGPRDALRMVRTISRAAQTGMSAGGLTFYSRAPFQLGSYAVRFRFAPIEVESTALCQVGPDALSVNLRRWLEERPLAWSFELQGYLDPERTPMDDHRTPWRSPWLPVAKLTVRSAGIPGEPLAFRTTPSWPEPAGAVFEPLGSLNRLRAAAYEASQRGRAFAGDPIGSRAAPIA